MAENEFKELNGYPVKDAVAREKIDKLSVFVTPGMYGAKGDGVTDDTEAIKQCIAVAVEYGLYVQIPKGDFLVTEPISVPTGVKICGAGAGSVIKKTNGATVTDKGKEVNSVLILNGRRVVLEDIAIKGDNGNGVYGVSFGTGANNFTINRLFIINCVHGVSDVSECWMGDITRVHCLNCNTGFYFGDMEVTKTSLNIRNCWAENCGDAYVFRNAMYSSLSNCGADWCNVIVENPYGTGYGNEASFRGVYHFESCKEITLMSCGTEYCHGNGAIYCGDSYLNVYGLMCYGLKSKWIPMYNVYPNFAQGIITTSGERCHITINGIMADTFENSAITTGYPGKPLALVGYNYAESAYGATDEIHIAISGITNNTGLPVFGGQGNSGKNCLYMDTMNSKISLQKYASVGSKRIGAARSLTGNSNRIVIPVTSQVIQNRTSLVKLTGIDNAYNNFIPYPFSVTVAFGHLDTVKSVEIIEKSNDGITAAAEGSNLVITLHRKYTAVCVDCEYYGNYVLWDQAYLG